MPFIALDPVSERPRIPVGVGDDEEVKCPVCGGILRVKDGSSRARHFYHPPETACGGESALHLQMKSIAAEKLQAKYPDATVNTEFVTEDVPRRADVFVKFDEPQFPLGKGIAVEVQYQNNQKDIINTTENYLTNGASVIWLFEKNYTGDSPDYEDVSLPSPVSVWPYAVPHKQGETSDEICIGLKKHDIRHVLPEYDDNQTLFSEFQDGSNKEEIHQKKEIDWSHEVEFNLNFSSKPVAGQTIYRAVIEHMIRHSNEQRQKRIAERRKAVMSAGRKTYFSEKFLRGSGESFEIQIEINPSSVDVLRVEKLKTEDKCETRISEHTLDSFIEFVLRIGCVLADSIVSSLTCNQTDKKETSEIGSLTYSIARNKNNSVVVEIYSETNTMQLSFCVDEAHKFIQLSSDIYQWYNQSKSVANSISPD
ncbi:competence protein CoiA [Salinarchaeum sp. IM2453]|uniref:competence protein CoiA family protein n=1 Tax=Salinarchaeum sp. IM2453 TaxID=2862870 RepID=UPI001C82C4D0|nr:competence protein CoiA family protein [Salinarchaeum sp. IM2453]QZA88523.1 competence protein CoiA [Salinarchaeum sp. IM2453]